MRHVQICVQERNRRARTRPSAARSQATLTPRKLRDSATYSGAHVKLSSDAGGLTQERVNRSNPHQVVAKPINTFEAVELIPTHGLL
jgi:hypothetical protein